MNLSLLPILIFTFSNLLSCVNPLNNLHLFSPNKQIELNLLLVDNQLKYRVNWSDKEVVGLSSLGIFSEAPVKIIRSKTNKENSSWKTVWGQFSTIENHYKELELDIEVNGVVCKLLARVYNDGVAFRFVIPKGEKSGKANFYCEYKFPQSSDLFVPLGESEPLGPVSFSELGKTLDFKDNNRKQAMKIPLVVETQADSFVALLESDLYSAQGFNMMNLFINSSGNSFFSSNDVELTNEEVVTPWRVILLGRSAGDLVVSTTPINLAAPSKLKDTNWVKPGLTLWDWRVHGYRADDGFVYRIDNASYKRFIDFAAEYGIDYFLIDDAWYKHVTKGHFELSDKLNLQEIIDYAKEKNVNLMLYYDRKHGEYGDEELFSYYSSLNMKGIKYGFMGSKVPFTRNAIEQSAENQLLIDFHDSPVPLTGIRRTLPNAITREYCHAQQDGRRAFTPEAFIKMALINAITGPLDMNNGNFDITGINSGKRQKGPRKPNTYLTTVVSEAARTLIIFSGLVCIPDAPEAYKAKKDLFEFIIKQPVGKWDESKILNSKIGEYITTARRSGKEWFIGSVISQKGGALNISLDFLAPDIDYEVTFYEDASDTHCKTNPEAYKIRKGNVKKDDVIKAVMAPGGGHCMWLRPALKKE